MLTCVLLYACSDSSTFKPETALAAESGAAQEGSISMPEIISVTFSAEGKVITAPPNNVPRAGFADGDTVIWSFGGDVAAQRLQVRPKLSSPFNGVPAPNQISGRIFPNGQVTGGMPSFEYDILRNGTPIEWADGTNGGCIKPIDPPRP